MSPIQRSSKSTRLRTMRALVLDKVPQLATVSRPRAAEGEVLVRVRACGIASSDLQLVRGIRAPGRERVILGHEFVGEVVEATTPAGEAWIGRRVVANLNAGCTRCLPCRDGKPWLCELTRDRALGMGLTDGALAEWVTISERALVEVPEGVDDEEAIFAHPLASALEASSLLEGPPPQRVLVVGDGNLGLLTTLVLHAAGHTVSVLGRHMSRRELLWRSGISFSGVAGADETAGDPVSGAKLVTESYGMVYDCSGHPSGFDLAVAATRPRGRIVLLSRFAANQGFDLRFLTENEIDLIGVNGGRLEDSLAYLQRKRLDILPLVAGSYSMQEAMTALEKANTRGTLKVLVRNAMGGGIA